MYNVIVKCDFYTAVLGWINTYFIKHFKNEIHHIYCEEVLRTSKGEEFNHQKILNRLNRLTLSFF